MDILTYLLSEGKEHASVSGKINIEDREIVLYIRTEELPRITSEGLFWSPFTDVTLMDTDAKPYYIDKIQFTQHKMMLTNNGLSQLFGTFNRLVKTASDQQYYKSARFSFDGIEKLFKYEQFITEHENGRLVFIKAESEMLQQDLTDSISCKVQSSFNGITESTELTELHLFQDKTITLFSSEKIRLDEWLTILDRVKSYFEFILKQEVRIRDVDFSTDESFYRDDARLIVDDLLIPSTFIKKVPDNPYRGSEKDLLIGLAAWMKNYDKYKQVISIWRKTILNMNVSEDDLFIWRAQAFELFCTITEAVHNQAQQYINGKQQYPNLKNYMKAVETVYKIGVRDETYYTHTKDVRDYLTHNNPNKKVDERKKKNSYKLIEYFLTKSLATVMDIKHISFSLSLNPFFVRTETNHPNQLTSS